MGKIFQIPLDKGYARGKEDAAGANIPVGYWTGKNMMYQDDGTLVARYSYIKAATGAVGSSSNIIKDLFLSNYGHIAIATDGNPYYRLNSSQNWTRSTWTGGGSAPSISASHPGNWGWLTALPVFTNCREYPIIFSGSGETFRYLTNAQSYLAHFSVEHQHRLLLGAIQSYPSEIRYSNVGNPDAGYSSNYVRVGDEMEGIVGMHHVSGNLLVLKGTTIWAKLGLYSELSSSQFQPVFQGISSVGGSIVARDTLFLADTSGILAFSGGSIKNLSEIFREEWKGRQLTPAAVHDILMTFWHYRDWLWVSCGSDCDTIWVLELNTGRWMRFSGLNPSCYASGRDLYFARYFASGNPYVYEFDHILGSNTEETTIEQILQTPYLDLGNPYADKFLRRIYLYAGGVDQVNVYLKTTPYFCPSSPSYTFTSPADGEIINCTPSKLFREISVKLTGDGDMAIKSISLEYEERRM